MIAARRYTEKDMLDLACGCCRKAGYPTHDDEYYSAINFAVAKAVAKYPSSELETSTLACTIALHECEQLRIRLANLKRGDEAGAKRGWFQTPAEAPPIPMADLDLLLFVAAHGKTKAARLLGMRYYHLMELLDDVQLRLRS